MNKSPNFKQKLQMTPMSLCYSLSFHRIMIIQTKNESFLVGLTPDIVVQQNTPENYIRVKGLSYQVSSMPIIWRRNSESQIPEQKRPYCVEQISLHHYFLKYFDNAFSNECITFIYLVLLFRDDRSCFHYTVFTDIQM